MPTPLGSAATLSDVAAFLGITDNFLRYVLYGRRDRGRYVRYRIPKRSGGYREISAPPKSLKIMQRKVARALLALHVPKPSSHGFLRMRSVVSNAQRHERQRVVGNIDLSNFFTTIHIGRVIKALQLAPYSLTKSAARVVGQICCDDLGVLPQGAPSSPILSNIICRTLDDQLQQLARSHGCRYTRYADDITFSTSRPSLPPELLYLNPVTGDPITGPALEAVVTSSGFAINPGKVRIALQERRQEVTGLTTNERANVGRWFIREMDSLMFIWRNHGVEDACLSFARHRKMASTKVTPARLANFLRGKLSYLHMVKGSHDPVIRRLQRELADLPDSTVPIPVDIIDLTPAPQTRSRGRFRGWQTVTNRYSNSIKFVEMTVRGELRCGSGFVVDSDTLVTAGHNAAAGPIRTYHGDEILYPSKVYFINKPGARDCALMVFDGAPFENLPPFHFHYRLPEIGEDVAAMGFPQLAYRLPTVVMHSGAVEALPTSLAKCRFIQTSFQGGGGLSGGPLVDRKGLVLGIMVENVFMDLKLEDLEGKRLAPPRAYGQALPFEYLQRIRTALRWGGEAALARFDVTIDAWPKGDAEFARAHRASYAT